MSSTEFEYIRAHMRMFVHCRQSHMSVAGMNISPLPRPSSTYDHLKRVCLFAVAHLLEKKLCNPIGERNCPANAQIPVGGFHRLEDWGDFANKFRGDSKQNVL